MDILVVGLSLGRTALEALEAARRTEALERTERRILALEGVREVVRLVTCHRVELVLGVSLPNPLQSQDAHGSAVRVSANHQAGATRRSRKRSPSLVPGSEHSVWVDQVVDRGERSARLSSILDEARRSLAVEAAGAHDAAEAVYSFAGTKAYRHLLRLAVGLESPLPGETEILGQMRAAYATAVENGRSSKILNGVFHRVFRAARRIRAQVGLDAAAPAWSEFLASAIVERSSLRPGASVRLVGSGSLARSLGLSLRARGLGVVEDGLEPNAVPISHHSGPVVVITASGRGRRIGLDDPAFQDLADVSRAHREVHVWDFGMPRNVDPAVAALPGVALRTLVDVVGLADPISSAHQQALESAQGRVEAEVRDYGAWRRERQLSSSLVRVGRLLEVLDDAAIGDASLPAADRMRGARARGRSGLLSGESRTFGRQLLKAFRDVAAEARSEDEAAERVALFEQVIESVVKRAHPSSIDPRPSLEIAETLGGGAWTRRASDSSARAVSRTYVSPSERASLRIPTKPTDGAAATSVASEGPPSRGWVSLVGAGPGDAGLLTLAAVARLRSADVVYHDALVTREILEYCRPDVRLVDVGKRRGAVSLPQRDIEAAMIRDARAGLAVVRLKGGDPFVFGRGGEEALALARAEIAFEVVPGVTSGVAAPSAAGIPLTHRGLSGSAAFVTAHDLAPRPDGGRAAERLRHLAQGADTLVLFMGGSELERARTILIEAGLSPRTPAAIVENGATPDQRVATGRLEDLHTLDDHWTGGPVLVVIGETVALTESLRSGGYTGRGVPERQAARPTVDSNGSVLGSTSNALDARALANDLEVSAGSPSDQAGRNRPPRSRISREDRRAG